MKSFVLFIAFAAAASISFAQTAKDNVRTPQTKAAYAVAQFTYGAVRRCKLASPESSAAYQIQLERLRTQYAKLVQLVVESPDYASYTGQLDKVRKFLPQTAHSATGDCGAFTSILKMSLDDPEMRKTFGGYMDILSKPGMDALLTPEIGGIKQFVEIKTDDASKPVLLFLSGGPGSSMMNNASSFTSALKKNFTIIQWDQRNAGKTLKLNPSPNQPSVAQMTQDTLQVIEFVRKELNQEKIYLLGSSWGNVLGFDIVEKHPELLHAYFAVNPVVSQLASEKELLDVLKAHFKDNPLASKELSEVNIPFKTDEDLLYLRKWLFYKDGKTDVTSDAFRAGFLQWSKAWSPVWNEVMNIDLPKTLPRVSVPIYFFVGQNDIQTSTKITEKYFYDLKAPKKELILFAKSGHQIHKDEPEKFQEAILRAGQ